MRYCKYLSSESGASLSRYALVEKRNGVLWATLPMQAPQEDLSARIFGGLPVPTLAVNFEPVPLSELNLLPPVTPSKILCVGRNYRDHAAELGNEVPKEPLLFLKPPSSLLAPKGTVRIPAISTRVDWQSPAATVSPTPPTPSFCTASPRRRPNQSHPVPSPMSSPSRLTRAHPSTHGEIRRPGQSCSMISPPSRPCQPQLSPTRSRPTRRTAIRASPTQTRRQRCHANS